MDHFRVKLQPVEAFLRIGGGGDRGVSCCGGGDKAVRERRNGISMAHPAGGADSDPFKQTSEIANPELGKTVFPFFRPRNSASKGVNHELHAVTDPQNRHAEIKYCGVDAGAVFFINARRPSGQDDSLWLEGSQGVHVDAGRFDLTIDAVFPHPAGDQLIVLGAEINDDDHGCLLMAQ